MLETKLLEKTKLKKPKLYKIFMLNDDISTMDFVIKILMDIFFYDIDKACELMLKIHSEGEALCGIFTQEIALSKQAQVATAAKEANFPLKTRIEEE